MEMQTRPGIRIPLQYLVMEGVGAILAGIGIARVFAGVDLLPWRVPFEHYGEALIVMGVALGAPLVVHLVKGAAAKQRGEPGSMT